MWPPCFEVVYTAMVPVWLEFGSVVWSSHLHGLEKGVREVGRILVELMGLRFVKALGSRDERGSRWLLKRSPPPEHLPNEIRRRPWIKGYRLIVK